MRNDVYIVGEPKLEFGYGESLEDPRLGLTMFGPYEKKAGEIRIGAIGTKNDLVLFKEFLKYLENPAQFANQSDIARPPFLGFENTYNVNIIKSVNEIFLEEQEIQAILYNENIYDRTYHLSDYYLNKILDFKSNTEEIQVDVWFVLVSQEIKKHCSPKSSSKPNPNVIYKRSTFWSHSKSKKLMSGNDLFKNEYYNSCFIYDYYPNFHHQLKAKLLKHFICTQILREELLIDLLTKVIPKPRLENKSGDELQKEIRKAELIRDKKINYNHYILWQLSSALFYKLGNRPWKLANIRERVCYVGLVYKKFENLSDYGNAVCAAQMFLDNGDGVVFKSNGKPHYNKRTKEHHLKKSDASDLINQALKSYWDIHETNPKELFIHSRTKFNKEEWEGFSEVCPSETKIIGITIKESSSIKFYRSEKYPIIRGTVWILNEVKAFLFTKGFIPQIHTTNASEVPNPLEIEITGGDGEISVIVEDILRLTKLNYNACLFGDGVPITLKFSDYVGEILTSVPSVEKMPPLHFKYYL